MSNNMFATEMITKTYKISNQPAQCAWCRNISLMYLICTGTGSEVFEGDYKEWFADHEWQVLMCPSCQQTNVLKFSKYEFDTIIIGMDQYENEITVDTYRAPTYLYPKRDISLPKPHPNMPSDVREDYEEACEVFSGSTRSAAALLRLAIQKLCKALGEKGKNINDDIGQLVKKGLPEHIQQALDIVRVIGNESVHPGEINIQDNKEVASQLFELVNEIVDDRLGKRSRQTTIRDMYHALPKSKLDSIVNRDSTS